MQRQFSNTGLRLLPVIAGRYGINRAMSYRAVSGNGVKCRLQYCTSTRYEPRVDRIGHGVKTNRVLLPGNAVIKDITYSTIVRVPSALICTIGSSYTRWIDLFPRRLVDCRFLELCLDTLARFFGLCSSVACNLAKLNSTSGEFI